MNLANTQPNKPIHPMTASQVHNYRNWEDNLLYSSSNSVYTPTNAPTKVIPTVSEWREVSPQSAAALDSWVTFIVPKFCHLVSKIDILFNVSALSNPTLAQAKNGLINQFGAWCFSEARLEVDNQLVHTVIPESFWIGEELSKANDQIFRDEDVGYIYSDIPNVLHMRARGVQNFIVPLKFPWQDLPSNFFNLVALRNAEVRIMVRLRSGADLTFNTDGTVPTFTITRFDLLIQGQQLTGQEVARVTVPRMLLTDEYQVIRNLPVTAQNQVILNINGFTRPCRELYLFVREDPANVPANPARYHDLSIRVVDATLRIDSVDIYRQIPVRYMRTRFQQMYHIRVSDFNLLTIPLSLDEESRVPNGSFNFSIPSQKELVLNFTVAITGRIDVVAASYDMIESDPSKGAMRDTWRPMMWEAATTVRTT